MSHGPSVIQIAERILSIEAEALRLASRSLDDQFEKAVQLILNGQGKVIVTGIGKSGLIGRKISSTFTSTGTPSTFLHPAEAAHGDLGLLERRDILIAISQSGESHELNVVLEHAVRLGMPIIGLSGNKNSFLAKVCNILINTEVSQEACPLGLAPSASSAKTLALGDALAFTVSQLKGFTTEDFRLLHPAGGIGKRLLKVEDLMHKGDELPLLPKTADIKEIILTMSRGDVRGACAILDEQKNLVGIITDGDLRRNLDRLLDNKNLVAEDIMSRRPKTIDREELAVRALRMMEEFRISVLLVTEPTKTTPCGIIHIQDLLHLKS
ncbi:MAG: KpsF/GutQ family sugar-phosphate isomerase [Bdellovibrionaceae bacterium]|nr:KpsF/GutQ family sugar-phosphate isomerase [Pseudobdellovibrionaceae bacterium]MDW8189695.1 KpsF/GutQ family sugar-phosphate isomerase [Pseudobdellovibrionaceae bacterium]